MKTFNSLYFLHIPKTAGRFFTHNVIVPLEPIIKEHGIYSHYTRDTYVAHQFWADFITDDTYIVSLLRDPVKHMVSVYSHYSMLDDGAQRSVPVGSLEYNKETMFNWIDKYKDFVSNLQSKNFLISNPDNGFIYSETTRDCQVSTDIIFNRLKKVSLILNSEDLTKNNVKKAQYKILDDFNISGVEIKHSLQKASNYWNPDSTRIYNSLTEKDKEIILSLSPIDSEIYNTKSLFYNLKDKND